LALVLCELERALERVHEGVAVVVQRVCACDPSPQARLVVRERNRSVEQSDGVLQLVA